MKSNILILFCCFLFLASCQAPSIEEYTLLPHPVDIKYIPGMVKLKTQPTLVYPGELANEALLLQCYLSSDFSVQATLKKNKKKGDIILQLDPAVLPEQAEGYILDATSGNIVLKANSPAGILNAIQTFRQVLKVKDGRLIVQKSTLTDYPVFSWRAFMLDEGRYFKGKEVVFDLLDEIEEELQIKVRPLSWPIDMGQRFRGVYNIFEQKLNLYTPSKQYVTENVEFKDITSPDLETYIDPTQAAKLREDIELIEGVYPEFDVNTYLDGDIAPVFFGSALNNFGVKELLDCFIRIAPSPRPIHAVERVVDPNEDNFTGFIFKIHANMDPNHRSCIAFVKICSGRFERNANYKHVRFGKMMRFSSPTAFMAQKKEVVDEAFAGDIIGLPDNGTFKIGDTLTEGEVLHFKGLPSFSPEMFKYIENADPMKQKQLAKGIDQLMDEGVAQLFVNQFNGRKIIGTVGQLQFEVIQYRLENEYSAKCRWEPLSLYKACWIESDDAAELEAFKKRKYQYMAKDREGRDVFLADSGYVLQMAQMDFKHIKFHFTSEF